MFDLKFQFYRMNFFFFGKFDQVISGSEGLRRRKSVFFNLDGDVKVFDNKEEGLWIEEFKFFCDFLFFLELYELIR